jgi:hypothetical protein
MINLQTRAKNYNTSKPIPVVHESTSSSHPDGPIQIEKPCFDASLRPSKCNIGRMIHNPNTRATHNYIIMEDLANEPCSMSTLKILYRFPSQQKSFLFVIYGVDPSESSLMTFDSD